MSAVRPTNTLGVSLVSDSPLDVSTLSHMREYITERYDAYCDAIRRTPTRTEFAAFLQIDRWRLARIMKALEIKELFN